MGLIGLHLLERIQGNPVAIGNDSLIQLGQVVEIALAVTWEDQLVDARKNLVERFLHDI